MHPSDSNEGLRARRKLLGAMASAIPAAALLGLNAPNAAASASPGTAAVEPPHMPDHAAPEEFLAQARLRSYKTRRSSSWDRTGGNGDFVVVEPSQAATLLEIDGAGVVTHLWFTINSPDPMHLKNMVLKRLVGRRSDAFGRGADRRFLWPGPGPVLHLPVSFDGRGAHQSAECLLSNAVCSLGSHYANQRRQTPHGQPLLRHRLRDLPGMLPDGIGRFHAQYRQAAPCHVTPGSIDGKT
jgi:hypothetical protein